MIKYNHPDGATEIDPNESEGLIPKHITTQGQLNEWEQNNIIAAEKWAFLKNKSDVLTIEFTKKLHKKMFDLTWKWAGDFRRSNKNLGVVWPMINMELGKLLEEVNYQLINNVYPIREIATRFHHKLVAIHCFANGNGRHARLAADILLVSLGDKRFSWGKGDLYNANNARKIYINSLRKADNYDYTDLLNFVDS
jgi:Fic-DOC domain mobile mystery protein B